MNLRRHLGDYLLRQNIERLFGHNNGVELASANAVHQRTGFDKVVARERKQNAFRRAIDRVATTTHSLQKCRNAFRRRELHHEIDRAHIDTKLHRRRRDQHLKASRLEPLLGVVPVIFAHTAVMRTDDIVAEALGKREGKPLGEPARVHEYQRRIVALD